MDGFQFLKEYKKLEIAKQSIDIIILTNSINPEDRKTAKKENCTGFFEKLLTEEKLLEFYGN